MNPLLADAINNDPIACFALADQAEEQDNLTKAKDWRWLANPPSQGWEVKANKILYLYNNKDMIHINNIIIFRFRFQSDQMIVRLTKDHPAYHEKEDYVRWNSNDNLWSKFNNEHPIIPPKWVKKAVIYVCKHLLGATA